jgi:hypothetical protein
MSIVAVCISSCSHPMDARPPEVDTTVRMLPADFVTGQAPDVPIVIELTNIQPWQSLEDFVRDELPAWHASSRVVRWPSREPIEGRWMFSNAFPIRLRFEPAEPLPRGWFALQVRFSDLPVRRATAPAHLFETGQAPQFLDDGWATARFHVGSLPTVQIWGRIDPPTEGFEGSGGSFSLFTSEPMVLERDLPLDGLLTVTLDGDVVDCSVPTVTRVRRADGAPLGGITWTCSNVPHAGHVEVTLRPLDGAPVGLRYVGEGNPPRWTGETGRWFSERDVPDSFFLEAEVTP